MNYIYDYDISIILVNYNGKRYIDGLLDSLLELKHDEFTYEIIFVDNNSSDESVDYLKSRYGDACNLKIVETGENRGFAGGNNAGVEASSGRYIVLLNNDTVVDENWLHNLYQFMLQHTDCGMANSKLLFYYDFVKMKFETKDKIFIEKQLLINGIEYQIDNKFCKNLLYEQDRIVCFGHSEICIPLLVGHDNSYEIKVKIKDACERDKILFGSVERNALIGEVTINIESVLVNQYKFSLIQNAGSGINENYDGYDIGFCERESEKYQKSYELTNGCGAAIMMLREDFDKAGRFDEKFFMYYEDTDLSFRIKKLGKKIMYCPTAVVRHIHTGSSKEWSPFFTYHVYRNKLLMIGKDISKKKYWKYFVRQLLYGIRYRDFMKIKGTLDSFKILYLNINVNYPNKNN